MMPGELPWTEELAEELRSKVVEQIDEGDPEDYTAQLAKEDLSQADGWALRRIAKTGGSIVDAVTYFPRKAAARISDAIDDLGKGFGIG